MTAAIWCCQSTDGPGQCENHTPHQQPRGCVHFASWCPDAHDRSEASDQ